MAVTREWPWGLVYFGDATWPGNAPSVNGVDRVSASETQIAVLVLHGQEGSCSVEVGFDPPAAMELAYSGPLDLSSGTIELSDAAREEADRADLEPGRWQVSVWTDGSNAPRHVYISLSEGARVAIGDAR